MRKSLLMLLAFGVLIGVTGCEDGYNPNMFVEVSTLLDWDIGAALNPAGCVANDEFGGVADCDLGETLLFYRFAVTDSRTGEPQNAIRFRAWTAYGAAGIVPIEVLEENGDFAAIVDGSQSWTGDASEMLGSYIDSENGLPSVWEYRTGANGVGEFALVIVSMPLVEIDTEGQPEWGDFSICVDVGPEQACGDVRGAN